MVRYELKKIFGSFGGKVTLVLYAAVVVLSCWLAAAGELNVGSEWVNEQGSHETGPAAVKKMQAARPFLYVMAISMTVTWLFAGTRSRGGVHATEVPRQISEYFLHSTELRLMHPCVPNWAALHWMQ